MLKYKNKSLLTGASIATLCALAIPAFAVECLTQHSNTGRSGANLSETVLTQTNVNSTNFGKVFDRNVDGELYAQPLAADNVVTSAGMHNVVYVATTKNNVYCFDAEDPTQSSPIWTVNLGAPVPVGDVQCCCTDMSDWAGVTGTGVIDRTGGTLYLIAKVKNGDGTYHQWLHALDITSGAEKFSGPKEITASASGVNFDAKLNHQRIGLLLQGGNVYAGWSSHNDCGGYHGWVIGYNSTTLAQVGAFPVTVSGGAQGGVWMSGGGLVGDGTSIFFTTGNGTFDLNSGGNNAGESFVRLNSTLARQDYFTPASQAALNGADKDLGGGGIMLIPGTSRLIGGGKDGKFYLVSTTAMGGYNASTDACIQSFMVTDSTDALNHLHGGPVYWDNGTNKWVYTWGESDQCKAFAWNGTTFGTTPASQSSFEGPANSMPGGELSISANGTSNGILWTEAVFSGNANNAVQPGILRAFKANDLSTVLWDSHMNQSRDDMGNFAKNPAPIVVNGRMYQSTFSQRLAAYGLNPTPAGTVYEAENATLAGGAKTNTNHANYSGTGFVDGMEAVGASVSFAVTTSVAGTYNVRLHYANALNSLNQQATQTIGIYVNGTRVKQTKMPDLGTWDLWGDVTDTLTLNSGSNTVKYQYDSGDTSHTNLDYIQVTKATEHYESESLTVAASSGDTVRVFADTNCNGGNGSIIDANAVNDFVTYSVNVPEARTYDIRIRCKKLNTRGIFQLAIAGSVGGAYTDHGSPVDEYTANGAGDYVTVDIGPVTFGSAGTKAFRFLVTGKNASSTGFSIASDYITLTPM